MPKLDLSEPHLALLLDLLREHLPEAEIWAHGSRVRGTSHPGSDLDLALCARDGTSVERESLARTRRALRESNLPMRVDLFDLPSLSEQMRAEIVKHRIPLRVP